MNKRIVFIIRYFLYWIIFFIGLKILFLFYNYKLSFHLLNQWTAVFWHGFRLDLSATGYIMLFPLLILLISIWLKGEWDRQLINGYTYFLVILFSILAASDLALYKEWGYRLDATPLIYLAKPKEAFASVSLLYIILHITIAGIVATLYIFFYRIFVFARFYAILLRDKLFLSGTILLLIGSMFIFIRSGFGKTSINTGSAYFSKTGFLNHAALNLPWNVGFSFLNNNINENPFKFFSDSTAQNLMRSFMHSSDVFPHLLNNERPNIILIILESFTANVTGCLKGPIHLTPQLDNIAHNGILFSQFFASGDRTDKGMLAVLSGFPSQPTASLIKYVNKTERLPALPKSLKSYGYTSTFYYGSDAEFANYKSYLLNSGFEKIVELKDFPFSEHISSWGVPDEYLFHRVLYDLKREKQPYFNTILTLSSHTPYDIPMKPQLSGNTDEIKFYNSIIYADQCIGQFVDSLKKEKLLNNTLMIFVADHGFYYPGNLSEDNVLKYHIPLIWYGNALNKRDTIINTIANQTDIAAMLLAQMNISSDQYAYSKNILSDNTQHKTTFEFRNGFGYVSDSVSYFFYNDSKSFSVVKGSIKERDKMEGKAFYQILYNDIIRP